METIQSLRKQVKRLKHELQRARQDYTFGILSRYGIDSLTKDWKGHEVHLLFGDLDKLHELNNTLGYKEVDKKVRTSFSNIKKHLHITK